MSDVIENIQAETQLRQARERLVTLSEMKAAVHAREFETKYGHGFSGPCEANELDALARQYGGAFYVLVANHQPSYDQLAAWRGVALEHADSLLGLRGSCR